MKNSKAKQVFRQQRYWDVSERKNLKCEKWNEKKHRWKRNWRTTRNDANHWRQNENEQFSLVASNRLQQHITKQLKSLSAFMIFDALIMCCFIREKLSVDLYAIFLVIISINKLVCKSKFFSNACEYIITRFDFNVKYK